MPWVLIPLAFSLVPILAIIAWHQQRMAEIRAGARATSSDVEALRSEIRELKALVHEQAIAMDTIVSQSTPLRERISA
jgi:hypothetical protein